MASVSFADLLVDKLLSFSSKMKDTSYKPGSALCLMSHSPNIYAQYVEEMLDQFLVNGVLASECEMHKPVQRTKTDSHFLKNIGYNTLQQNQSGFSPHLFNVVQDSLKFMFGQRQPDILPFTSNGFLSHVLSNSFLSNSFIMKDNLHPKVDSCVQPVNETKLKMSVSVKNSSLKEGSEMKNKLNSVNELTLNVELANRKTKEINKRSKKRRRRQKKNKTTAKCTLPPKDVDSPPDSSSTSSRVQEKSEEESNFILSVEHKISPNLVSTFVISVGSVSDEDSEWDSCSEADQPELADFEFTGLFLTNLCTPAPCLHPPPSPIAECTVSATFQDEDDEIARMQAVLITVNKNWNESTKGIETKPKSPSKVCYFSAIPSNVILCNQIITISDKLLL